METFKQFFLYVVFSLMYYGSWELFGLQMAVCAMGGTIIGHQAYLEIKEKDKKND